MLKNIYVCISVLDKKSEWGVIGQTHEESRNWRL